MMPKAAKHKEESASSEEQTQAKVPESDASVDRIRDILFGVQMRDYDSRFAELEEDFRQRERELRSRLEEATEDFSARVAEMEKRTSETLDRLEESLRQELRERSQTLQDSKTDRQDLAALLREVAESLEKNS